MRCFGIVAVAAGCSSAASDSRALFGEADSLAPGDAAAIHDVFAAMFPPSTDGRFEDPVCGDVQPLAQIVDLNGDGAREVFIEWGNACTSGGTGRSLSLFIKNGAGEYRDHFGFPALGHTALPDTTEGFPDLELGGPGFCFAVWAWNGDAYEFKCNSPQEPGGCESQTDVCSTN